MWTLSVLTGESLALSIFMAEKCRCSHTQTHAHLNYRFLITHRRPYGPAGPGEQKAAIYWKLLPRISTDKRIPSERFAIVAAGRRPNHTYHMSIKPVHLNKTTIPPLMSHTCLRRPRPYVYRHNQTHVWNARRDANTDEQKKNNIKPYQIITSSNFSSYAREGMFADGSPAFACQSN